ncbi:MAG: OmpH family outer membrane protein [Proteobacteria bacterium]|nr:OmpH family outer membrane protein [Pseudomonadota bacterium]NOG60822.1 OmpH family outer membrane protein [Pseudomonadota bacterium]
MKNSFKFLISISFALVFAFQVQAAEELKIGAVQVLKILEQSPQYKAAGKSLDKEFEARSKTLIAEQKKIKSLEDKLGKDKAIMSETEISKMERDILNKRRDYKRSQDEFREDINFRRNEELSKIQKVIFEAIQKVAKENNYDVVLSEGVIYASSKADMTQLVIDSLNK